MTIAASATGPRHDSIGFHSFDAPVCSRIPVAPADEEPICRRRTLSARPALPIINPSVHAHTEE
jgi:hypothetical protein